MFDNIRNFILKGFSDADAAVEAARRLSQIKAPHAYVASGPKPRFNRRARRAMRATSPMLLTAPYGRLFKGHRP